MYILTAFVLAVATVTASASVNFYDICDQVRLLGYPCEHHNAQTADGFVLDIIRLPPNSGNNNGTTLRSHKANFKQTFTAPKVPLHILPTVEHSWTLNAPMGHAGLTPEQRDKHHVQLQQKPRQLAALQRSTSSSESFGNGSAGAYPIVLQHGLVDSAITWVANKLPSQNLACILHDQGYDVWMPNSRGNHYSQYNIYFPTAADQNTTYFQLVDMDWMAKYDLPAVIDTVLAATGKKSLSWVGHSQGTWQGFTAFSYWNKNYASMVDVFVALAPVARIAHFNSEILRLLFDMDMTQLIEMLGFKWFLVNDWLIRKMSPICEIAAYICDTLIGLLVGFGDMHNLDVDQFPTIMRYDPGGTSVNNIMHYQQAFRRGNFAAHDYGTAANNNFYGSPTPPLYDPSQMTSPKTVLCSGGDDYMADPKDVAWLKAMIPNSTVVDEITIDDYDHMDFVWGLDAHTRLYPFVLRQIAKFKQK